MSANYNGRQSNRTSYIKNFTYGIPQNLFKLINQNVVTTAKPLSVVVQDNLYVGGLVPSVQSVHLSDLSYIDPTRTDILQLQPCYFTDNRGDAHYGFVGEEFSQIFPSMFKFNAININEIIPLLVEQSKRTKTELNNTNTLLTNTISELNNAKNEIAYMREQLNI